MIDLNMQTAIVTGAARGLGRALARTLGQQGIQVVLADIDRAGAEETASEIEKSLVIETDITDYEQCRTMAQKTVAEFGSIDLLVANAALLIAESIEDFSAQDWKKVIDVNLCGFFNSCKAVIPQMKKQDRGNIIQINSKSGKKGSFKNSAYAASKFGGIGLVQSLALELAEENIRVNAICPGNLLDSPLWKNKLFKEYAENRGITEEEVRELYVNKVPMKKGCSYEDVANVMLFLASDMSSYMTGQAINVTGGQQMD